jgi:hypothetical protein
MYVSPVAMLPFLPLLLLHSFILCVFGIRSCMYILGRMVGKSSGVESLSGDGGTRDLSPLFEPADRPKPAETPPSSAGTQRRDRRKGQQ